MSWERPASPAPLSGDRHDVYALAMRIMGDTTWKNSPQWINEDGTPGPPIAPAHDHTLGSEQGLTFCRDGRQTFTRLHNCPRCGDAAADRIWPLALAEAARRLGIEWSTEIERAS